MNRFAKVINGVVAGIQGSELEYDERRNEAGELIWRRVVEHIPQYDPSTEMLGEKFMTVSDEIVIESYSVIPLSEAPTIEQRLDALEAGDVKRVELHHRLITSLRNAGKLP
jgi:hypothetical protein